MPEAGWQKGSTTTLLLDSCWISLLCFTFLAIFCLLETPKFFVSLRVCPGGKHQSFWVELLALYIRAIMPRLLPSGVARMAACPAGLGAAAGWELDVPADSAGGEATWMRRCGCCMRAACGFLRVALQLAENLAWKLWELTASWPSTVSKLVCHVFRFIPNFTCSCTSSMDWSGKLKNCLG